MNMGTRTNEDNTNKVILMAEQNYNHGPHDVVVNDFLEKENHEEANSNSVKDVEKESVTEEEKEILVAFYEANNEFIGLLKSESITLPVYKTNNNEKYLKVGQNGKKNGILLWKRNFYPFSCKGVNRSKRPKHLFPYPILKRLSCRKYMRNFYKGYPCRKSWIAIRKRKRNIVSL